MIDNKPFAMFFNVSPRKGWNTYKMLEAAKADPNLPHDMASIRKSMDSADGPPQGGR